MGTGGDRWQWCRSLGAGLVGGPYPREKREGRGGQSHYVQSGVRFHREDGVVLPFKVNLKRRRAGRS